MNESARIIIILMHSSEIVTPTPSRVEKSMVLAKDLGFPNRSIPGTYFTCTSMRRQLSLLFISQCIYTEP
jgi:hypothetical protein